MKNLRFSDASLTRCTSDFGLRISGFSITLCLLASLGCLTLRAADTNKPAAAPALTPQQMFEGGSTTYNNWIEFSAGGFLTHGDRAQAAQNQHLLDGAFGGIEDLHFQQSLDKKTVFSLDGHGIYDQHNYDLRLGVNREDLGYLRFGFENYRTWYDSSGGFFPADGSHFTLGDSPLGLDRGQISVEAGLTPKNAPHVIFKYTHRYRDGQKSSTEWGMVDSSLGGSSIYPGFYDIDEKADIFQLDVTHHIKKTDFGLGITYENGSINNALKTFSFPNDPSVQRRITDREGSSYDLLSVHAFTETWFKNTLMFSTGFLFANLDNDFTGSRIYGDDFDVPLVPDPNNGFSYTSLNGGSHKQEYVLNLNLLAVPVKSFTIVPSIRVQDESWNASSSGMGSLADFASEPFSSHSDRDLLEVRERLDLRYNGFTNWVLYAGPEWTEGQGNLKERGGLSQINGIGVAPVRFETDDSHLYQKYFIGARWYPTRWLTIEPGGYLKDNHYDYDTQVRNAPNSYPGFLVMQSFRTWDGNLRVTIKPLRNLSFVSRYEYQYSTIETTPDATSALTEIDSSKMTSHIFSQNVSWTPWDRLTLQAGGNLVLSDTRTPASDVTQAILKAQNNYWTLNFNSSLVVDNKTDLNAGYFYYESADFQDNSASGLPLGAAAREHGITASLSRRLTQNLRLNLRYGYTHYEDSASGGHNDYAAHLIYSSLQYRF